VEPSAAAGIPASFVINGSRHDLTIPPWITLLDLLRERLQLTGTRRAVITGSAGPARSWLMGSDQLLSRAGGIA